MFENLHSRSVKLLSEITSFFVSMTHTAVKFASSMGFSDMADRKV